jgi:hypothetical protein
MEQYFDVNGHEIKAGMTLVHDDGDESIVYSSDDDLGLNASNEEHLSFSEFKRLIYPLYQFNLKEFRIKTIEVNIDAKN